MSSYVTSLDDVSPDWAPALGFMGVAAAVVLSNVGGAFGTYIAARSVLASGISSPELVMKNIIPIVMAGVLGIYGLIVAVIIQSGIEAPDVSNGQTQYTQIKGWANLCAGMCCGQSSLASGIAIGIAADVGTRAVGAQSSIEACWKKMGFSGDGVHPESKGDSLFVATVLIQVFAGNIGLYGMIVALILTQMEGQKITISLGALSN